MHEKKTIFNPRSTYQWEPDAPLSLTGLEFNILLNTINEILESKTTSDITISTIASVAHCQSILSSKLREMAETGVAKALETDLQH